MTAGVDTSAITVATKTFTNPIDGAFADVWAQLSWLGGGSNAEITAYIIVDGNLATEVFFTVVSGLRGCGVFMADIEGLSSGSHTITVQAVCSVGTATSQACTIKCLLRYN